MRAGLCSVTYRQLAAEELAVRAADAGLEVIEWGGDVHVPPGDPERAAEVAAATAAAGLRVCSYGSYFRAGAAEQLTPVLDSAAALGADRVRIWAGRVGSAEASPEQYAQVVSRLRDAGQEASERGISLALEFHRGTVSDHAQATLRLLDDVGSTALSTYWQPGVGLEDDAAVAEYEAVAPRTSAVHVFSWWPDAERLRLHERAGLWQRLFAVAQGQPTPPRDALLEFVVDDDPALLAAEAATLRALLTASSPRPSH